VQGKAQDVKQHRWFEGFDWESLAARKVAAPRKPRDDAAKRIRELVVSNEG
jgi:cGMP-dependent protein kinase 2